MTADTADLAVNLELEADVLSMCLTQPDFLYHVPFLRAEHFYDRLHRDVFAECERRLAAGEGVAVAALAETLGEYGYLVRLVARGLHVYAPLESARRVAELAGIRRLLDACRKTLADADADPGTSFAELAGTLQGEFQAISAEEGVKRQRRDDVVTSEIIEDLKTRKLPTSTGLVRLDEAMGGGLFAGRSYGFAARKKVGKTILASSISYNLNRQKVPHLFIAGEMGAKEIHERCLARELDCYPSAFRSQYRDSPQFLARLAGAAVNSNRCIIYQDAPGHTFSDLRRYVASAIYQHKIQGVVLDYWQLVGGKAKGESDASHLDKVAQWIADFCRQHGVWSVTMAQINQEGNTRGGEGIRLAFDQVYQIHREDVTQPTAWLEMMDTRYTRWMNVGDEHAPGLLLNEKGPYFEQA